MIFNQLSKFSLLSWQPIMIQFRYVHIALTLVQPLIRPVVSVRVLLRRNLCNLPMTLQWLIHWTCDAVQTILLTFPALCPWKPHVIASLSLWRGCLHILLIRWLKPWHSFRIALVWITVLVTLQFKSLNIWIFFADYCNLFLRIVWHWWYILKM